MGPIFIPASDRTNIQQKSRKVLNSMDFVKILSMGIYRKPMEFSHGKKKGVPVIFPVIFPTNPLMNPFISGFYGVPQSGDMVKGCQGIGCCKEPSRTW